jgi:Flp pilus assembly protein TadG
MMRHQRGQALIETAFFLPVLLLAMMAIIYFSQYGVLQIRAAEAVRYASLVTDTLAVEHDPSKPYSIEAVYAELDQIAKSGAAGFPSSTYSCTAATNAASAAFWQSQTPPPSAPGPYPSAQPWFHGTGSVSPHCFPIAVNLPTSGNSNGISNNLLMAEVTTLTTSQTVPTFLTTFSNVSSTGGQVGAAMAYVYANPASGVGCNPNYASLLNKELGPVMPATTGYASLPNFPNPAPKPAGCS